MSAIAVRGRTRFEAVARPGVRRTLGELRFVIGYRNGEVCDLRMPGKLMLVETEDGRVEIEDLALFRFRRPIQMLEGMEIAGVVYKMADDRADAKGALARHFFQGLRPVVKEGRLYGPYTVGPEGIRG